MESTHTPAVSVIVPNYNHAPFLRQRIDSILNQTFQDLELIILDDCSTDDSRRIIESYRNEPRVRAIIYNEANSGSTFAQWKRGLRKARGRYVWIAESDDYADADFLSVLVETLEKHPEAAVAFTGSVMVDANGEEIAGMDWDRYRAGAPETEEYDGDEFLRRKLLWTADLYNASMALFRRETAPEIEDVQLRMRYCGDWLFWVNMSRKGSAVEVRRKLNRFRQHNLKVSPGASKAGLYFLEGLPIMERVADALKLNSRQRRMLAGRTLKRLRKFPQVSVAHGDEIRRSLERLSPGSTRYPGRAILWYETDKYLNLTGLHHKYK